MGKLYGILLIIALVIVSGVIAYVGDIVGRRMGRKRLSLFGLRPRHTAIVISVVSGMLITIFTLGVAMSVNKDVKDGFLRVVEMRQQQADLSAQLGNLKRRTAELDQARRTAERQLQADQAELAQTKRTLQETGAKLREEEKKLARTSKTLGEKEGDLQRAWEAAKRQWDAAKRQADELARLAEARDELERYMAQAAGEIAAQRGKPIIFGVRQQLRVELVTGGGPIPEIRKQLDDFVAHLDEVVRAAGAGPGPDGGRAVVLRKLLADPKTGSVTWITADQVLDAVAEGIHDSTGGVILRAISTVNTRAGEPVRVDFELFQNHLVFSRGQVLAETILDGRLSPPALMEGLVSLLRDEVGEKARAENVMPRSGPGGIEVFGSPRGAVGEMSFEELFAVIARLEEIAGPARVRAVAAADTWTLGPLEVDLLVEPIGAAPGAQGALGSQ